MRIPSTPRLIILDDHITPYRIPIFTHLHREEVDLRVLYCAARLPERQWEIPEKLAFPNEILPSPSNSGCGRRGSGEPRVILG